MKVGDTKKVVILSVIAIVVLTVAVVRSIPMADLAVSAISAVRQSDEPSSEGAIDLPRSVQTNPFYHPKLATAANQTSNGGPPARAAQPTLNNPLPRMPGALPATGPFVIEPEDVAGPSQQSIPEPKKKAVLVEAVLEANGLAAMISVDDGVAKVCRQGDPVMPGLRVVAISQDGVVLRTAKGSKTIGVGRRLEI